MRAHLCLTPWNWPIGRPNCTRVFAYSDAVDTHQDITPIASAPRTTVATDRTRCSLEPVEDPVGAHVDGVGRDPCGTAEHVDAVLHRDGDVRGIDDGPADVVADGDRE